MRFCVFFQKASSLLLLLCIYFSSVAQFQVKQVGKGTGLSSNVIYDVIQDSRGYIWLGTEDGLSRYDGYNFKTYRHNSTDSNSISSNTVYSICEDGRGVIWAATQNGLNCLDPQSGLISRIDILKNSYLALQVVNAGDNHLMVLTSEGVVLYNSINRTSKITPLHGRYDSLVKPVSIGKAISLSDKGEIFLIVKQKNSENHDLLVYDPINESFFPYKKYNQKTDNNGFLTSFYKKGTDEWLGTSRPGTLRRKGNVFKKDFIIVNHIFNDRDGNIWTATDKGVYFVNPFGERQGELITVLPGFPATNIFEDRSGLIWISGLKGVYTFDPRQLHFNQFTTESNLKLNNNFILGIRKLGLQKMMVEYYWGERSFSVIDLTKPHISHFSRDQVTFSDFVKTYLIKNREFFDSTQFHTWLPRLKYYENSLRELGSSVLFDKRKNVWLFLNESSLRNLASENVIYEANCVELIGDSIWLGKTGASVIDINTGKHHVFSAEAFPGLNTQYQITAICADQNGNVWIGSKGGGLQCYNRKTKNCKLYSSAHGLASNSVYSLVNDLKGRLWIGTSNGLSCFVPGENRFYNFYQNHGLVNSEFNRNSAARNTNGWICMGGMDGIDYFDPEKIFASVTHSNVEITDLKVFNKSYSATGKLTLPYHKNYITIEFAVMDFRNTENHNYVYKLEGIDKDWVNAGNQHSVSYATLSPGKYHFKVKSISQQGESGEGIAEMYFTISKPWWMSIWFFTGVAILTVGIFYTFYKFRVAHLKRLIHVRSKISQDLHDEVGATLTTISFLSEVAKNQTKETNPVYDTINKIGGFSRDMIDEMNDIVWAINPSNDRFGKIEDRMQNFASTLLGAREIELDFCAEEEIKNISLGMQQRKNLFLIFKEAINNAAKYADCSKVKINVYRKDHHINFEILDNGKGFEPGNCPKSNGGNGLSNMQLRALEIKAKLRIDSKPGRGTHISVSVPITPIAYS